MLGRLIGVVIRNPLGVLAAAAVVGSWGAISVNAMWLQTGPHPAPFLGRDTIAGVPAKLPPARPDRQVAKIDPASAEDADRARLVAKQMELTRDLQIELARRNFYTGGIDGQYGPRTEAAIRDYERMASLADTGQPSEALLAHVRMSTLQAPPQPVPSPVRPAPGNETAIAPATPVQNGDPVAALLEQADEPAESPSVAPQQSASAPVPVPPSDTDRRIEAVQAILADLGYAPGSIDGRMSSSTKRAIEDFEVDRGMPMTGQISPKLLQELTAVSGVPLG
ncbi:peptidoglycan-binding domain-containing protein [Microbaculum marinisediminis]|uniref:Peptidoglycan-binding protein n=1 Tax=Microbaculum marinisediminis TaxID=2931392 RepID=A0AAW5QX59_9HYPH|nr:peptidoglycan-binding protein [Microbaculum sp. A6E488]MCT8971243.1 peptidoglycan-binding protein [Microbaculum sp. A6E488]